MINENKANWNKYTRGRYSVNKPLRVEETSCEIFTVRHEKYELHKDLTGWSYLPSKVVKNNNKHVCHTSDKICYLPPSQIWKIKKLLNIWNRSQMKNRAVFSVLTLRVCSLRCLSVSRCSWSLYNAGRPRLRHVTEPCFRFTQKITVCRLKTG